MAILETTTKRFIGLSSDTKPSDAPAGSSYLETDTGLIWRWDGHNWHNLEHRQVSQVLAEEMLAALWRIRDALEHLVTVGTGHNFPPR